MARCAPRCLATPSAPTIPSGCCTRLKRVGPKGSGQFARIGWDEALDTVASRLREIAERAPEAVLPYSYAGTMGLVQGEAMALRVFHKLGASFLDRTICSSAGGEALAATYGGKVGMHLEHYAESKLIVIWGSNSITSNLHFWTFAQQAKRNGAKLWCIDPRRTETAEKCHRHLALLPGTDGALALAVMHELITRGWLDDDYIARHVQGFDQLRAKAMEWTPERAAAECGLQADDIRELAREYGNTQPAAIRLNYGMQRVAGGGNASRLIALAAVPHRCVAPSRRWAAAVVVGLVQERAQRRRALPAAAAGRPQAAHDQHDHDRRRPAA